QNVECQRDNWSFHKARCAQSQENIMIASDLDVGERHEDFVQWCKRSRELRNIASSWALNSGTEQDLSQTHLLIIYLTVDEVHARDHAPVFRRRLDRVECVSEAGLRAFAQSEGLKPDFDPPQPGCARILLVDSGMPIRTGTVSEMLEQLSMTRLRAEVWPNAECDWMKLLGDSLETNRAAHVEEYLYFSGVR
ncbi:hypothetical protein BDZ89DRAFT_958574, partial [Hymenopellis radicata]